MKVETLSEKDINAIGHAFGYYEYAQGEKGLVSAYSSKKTQSSVISTAMWKWYCRQVCFIQAVRSRKHLLPINAVMKSGTEGRSKADKRDVCRIILW